MNRDAKGKFPEERSAADFLPHKSLKAMREAVQSCRGCDLYARATQAVFGQGPHARVVFVGEQPGDMEDKRGVPFVGPAGRILDKALDEVGIDRKLVYVTNAVKHFKWTPRGKKRLHAKPNSRKLAACRPWLESEIALLKPDAVVALAATAGQSLFGPQFRVTRERGRIFASDWARQSMATVHPSSILAPDDAARHAAYEAFVDDMRTLAQALKKAATNGHE